MKMTTELEVKGMSCENCVKHVRRALEDTPGVDSAEVSLAQGYAVIRHDESTTAKDLIAAVEEEGYEAQFKDQRE